MQVIPAIDIKLGKVVRLVRGDYAQETVYSDDPAAVAQRWASGGATMIHVVDLDGALAGSMKNLDAVKCIKKNVNIKIEFGGGIRSKGMAEEAFEAGVDRIVIGTRALDDKFLKSIGKRFGKRIVVSIDAEGGMVRTEGWVSKTAVKAIELAQHIAGEGIGTVIYTDIASDGMLEGPNIASIEELLMATRLNVIASGGISTLEDLVELKALESRGLVGVIIGKALYEGKIDLAEALKLC